MFFYLKTKGEVENILSTKKIDFLTIYRPALLVNRFNARLTERMCSYIPFIDKIDVKNVAQAMKIQAENNETLA